MRIEITLVVFIIAVLAVSFAERRRPRLRMKDILLLLLGGLALTALSLLYVDTRYAGTVLQDFRGYPREFYFVSKSSADGAALAQGSHFHWRFFFENLIIYTSLLAIITVLVRRMRRLGDINRQDARTQGR